MSQALGPREKGECTSKPRGQKRRPKEEYKGFTKCWRQNLEQFSQPRRRTAAIFTRGGHGPRRDGKGIQLTT